MSTNRPIQQQHDDSGAPVLPSKKIDSVIITKLKADSFTSRFYDEGGEQCREPMRAVRFDYAVIRALEVAPLCNRFYVERDGKISTCDRLESIVALTFMGVDPNLIPL